MDHATLTHHSPFFYQSPRDHPALHSFPTRRSSDLPSSKMDAKKSVVVNKEKSALPSFTKSLYTPEIIQFIIELVEQKKKTPPEIIEHYRIPKTTLYKWIRKHRKTEI